MRQNQTVLFETRAEVIVALNRYRDAFVPKSGSIIFASRSDHDPSADPFRAGFLTGIEVRDELIRRMKVRKQSDETHPHT